MLKYGSLLIIGAGGFAREIESLLSMENQAFAENMVFFVDDEYMPAARRAINREGFRDRVVGREFIFSHRDMLIRGDSLMCIGDPVKRKSMVQRVSDLLHTGEALHFPHLVSKTTFVGNNVTIGQGFISCQNTVFTCNIKIGEHCHFNLNSTVGHDCIIGDYVTVSPGAKISGNVKIGNNVYIGSNAVIKEGVSICDNVTIGACAFVGKDIVNPGVYVGVPAYELNKK